MRWTNWYGNQSCDAAGVLRPASRDELCQAVAAAARRGRIRVVGNGTSWSPLVPTDGTLLSMERLRRVQAFDRDGLLPMVRVEAGATIAELTAFLDAHDLSLLSPPVFGGITVGGAVSTGTHGSGLHTSSLSDDVIAMTVIDAAGRARQLTDGDGPRFLAAQVALGTFGVLYDVTLRCVPRFNVLVEDRYVDRDTVLGSLADLVESNQFVELYWFPDSDKFLCKMMRHVDVSPDARRRGHRIASRVQHGIVMALGEAVLPWIVRARPQMTPLLLTTPTWLPPFRAGSQVMSCREAFHYQKSYPRCISASLAVPIPAAAAAMRSTIALVERERRRGRFPLSIAMHARFIGASGALLSPAHGEAICDLEVVAARGTPHLDEFYDAFDDALSQLACARPHWGKHISRPARIRSLYPKIDEFLAYREELDPERVFLNRFLEREVFQLAG